MKINPNIKRLLQSALPLVAFAPLLVASRIITKGTTIPPWFDWVLLFGSAALAILNPWLKEIQNKVGRAAVTATTFVLWSAFLYYLTFWLLMVFFSEGL